jgi:hypothetical protein
MVTNMRRLEVAVFLGIGLYFALMAALAAFFLHPPLLGWIGLAVAGTIATLAAVLALTFLSRMRTNAPRLHPHEGAVHRLLVVADEDVEPGEIGPAVRLRTIGRRAEVRVVAPIVPSPLHFLSVDEGRETVTAGQRLRSTMDALAAAGVTATGMVGTDDPLQAVGDTLAEFPADEILLIGRLPSRRVWLDQDFERQARDRFGVPVSTVYGAPAVATASTAATLSPHAV